MYEEFEIIMNNNSDEGSIFGYISDCDENFLNFLEKNDYFEEDFISLEKYKNCKKAYICNLYIEEEYRGNGNGTYLMNEILEDMYYSTDVKYVFLVCDNIESNNFSLQKWYESYDFEVIADKYRCPLMVLGSDDEDEDCE